MMFYPPMPRWFDRGMLGTALTPSKEIDTLHPVR
jgi:hypothetical protein